MLLFIFLLYGLSSQPPAELRIAVRSEGTPVAGAQVVVGGKTSETNAEGRVTLQIAPGPLEITVVKEGFNPVTVTATAAPGPPQEITVELEPQTEFEEHVTVSAT